MQPQGCRVPQGLDDPPRFLLWSADLDFIVLVFVFCGAFVNYVTAGSILGFVAAFAWHRLSAVEGRGFAAAILFWPTGLKSFVRTPRSHLRNFVG